MRMRWSARATTTGSRPCLVADNHIGVISGWYNDQPEILNRATYRCDTRTGQHSAHNIAHFDLVGKSKKDRCELGD